MNVTSAKCVMSKIISSTNPCSWQLRATAKSKATLPGHKTPTSFFEGAEEQTF